MYISLFHTFHSCYLSICCIFSIILLYYFTPHFVLFVTVLRTSSLCVICNCVTRLLTLCYLYLCYTPYFVLSVPVLHLTLRYLCLCCTLSFVLSIPWLHTSLCVICTLVAHLTLYLCFTPHFVLPVPVIHLTFCYLYL